MNAVFLSYTDGYPLKFSAANTKFSFLSRGLFNKGVSVTCVNKFYGDNNVCPEDFNQNGIRCISLRDKKKGALSLLLKSIKLCHILKSLYIKNEKNHLYFGCGNCFVLFPIIIMARLYGYKVVFILEEWLPSMNFTGLYRINALIHGYYMGYLSDYIMPISEFLITKSQKFKKPVFKLPICADFDMSPIKQIRDDGDYFLYCASASYKRAIMFVLEAFTIFSSKYSDTCLHLVIKGTITEIDEIKKLCQDKGIRDRVKILSDLPYDQLLFEYQNSTALLIPLFKDNITDIARFSQKISEYLSSKRPIISSAVGEIPVYFIDQKDMYIDEQNTEEGYAYQMKLVISDRDKASEVGINGYYKGQRLFDYRVLVDNMIDFLKKYN